MADDTIDYAHPTHSATVSRLHAAANSRRAVGTPIPVHIPLGNNLFLYVGDLPPSRGTGVFIPNVHEIVHGGHGGAEDGGHGNLIGGGRARTRCGGHATHFGCEFIPMGTSEPDIDEEEGAQLIGIELYKHINFNT